jgi:hypothetical protein
MQSDGKCSLESLSLSELKRAALQTGLLKMKKIQNKTNTI